MNNRTILEVSISESGEVVYNVPLTSILFWKQKYGRIGQLLNELSGLIQRRQFPHFMQYADMPVMHIYPKTDIFKHVISKIEMCPCNPRVDIINHIIIHNPMDPSISEEDHDQWEEATIN